MLRTKCFLVNACYEKIINNRHICCSSLYSQENKASHYGFVDYTCIKTVYSLAHDDGHHML